MGETFLKKIFLTIAAMLMILLCASCSENVRIPEVMTAVDGNASVTYNGTDYQCRITYVSSSTASVELLSPDNLKGLTFRRTENGQSFDLGSLVCKSSCFRFGDNCIGTKILQVFDSIRPEHIKFISPKGDLLLFSAKDNTPLTFLTDRDGHIRSLSTPELKIQMT